jgi:DnaK suppressor protein
MPNESEENVMSMENQVGRDNEELRERLEARRRGLVKDLQRRIARIRESGPDTTPAKQTEESDADYLDVNLLEVAATTLHRIEVAIERLDAGRYGRCTQCHNMIGEARLRAVPFAVCCQQCATTLEGEIAQRARLSRPRSWTDAAGVHDPPRHHDEA